MVTLRHHCMQILIAIAVIAIIAFIGGRASFSGRKLPLGFRAVFLAGTAYIVFGVVLGHSGLGLFDAETLSALEPALLFTLGWVGFLVGLQFNVRKVRALPHGYFSITVIEATVTFVVVASASFLCIRALAGIDTRSSLQAAAVLGAIASSTSPTALAAVAQNYKFKNTHLASLLRYISGADALVALVLFGFSFALFPQPDADWTAALRSVGLSLGLGIVPALVLVALNRTRFTHHEFLLFLIGTVMFGAGLAATFEISPLVTGLVCGLVTANFCPHHARAFAIIARGEHFFYVILLVLIGASVEIQLGWAIVFMGIYFCVRLLGKIAGTFLATRVFRPGYPVPAMLGLGLLPEGGLAVAMLVSYTTLSHHPLASSMAAPIIFSMLASELLGPHLIVHLFRIEEHRHDR